MLTCPVVHEFVQTVAGRELEIVERFSSIDHSELYQDALLNLRRQLAAALTGPDAFGFFAGE